MTGCKLVGKVKVITKRIILRMISETFGLDYLIYVSGFHKASTVYCSLKQLEKGKTFNIL